MSISSNRGVNQENAAGTSDLFVLQHFLRSGRLWFTPRGLICIISIKASLRVSSGGVAVACQLRLMVHRVFHHSQDVIADLFHYYRKFVDLSNGLVWTRPFKLCCLEVLIGYCDVFPGCFVKLYDFAFQTSKLSKRYRYLPLRCVKCFGQFTMRDIYLHF